METNADTPHVVDRKTRRRSEGRLTLKKHIRLEVTVIKGSKAIVRYFFFYRLVPYLMNSSSLLTVTASVARAWLV